MLSTRATSSRYGGELRQVRLPVSDGSESFSGREGRDSALRSVNKIDERTKPTYRPTDRTPPRRRTSLRCRAGRTPRLAPLFGGTPPQLPRRLRRMGRETLARLPLRRRSGLPPSHGTDRGTGGVSCAAGRPGGVSSESPVQPPAPCCWSPDFSSAARQDSKSPTFGSSSRRQRPPYTPKRRCSSFSRSRKRCGSRRRNPRSATMPPRSTSTKMPESRSRKRRWPHSTSCSYPTASRRP